MGIFCVYNLEELCCGSLGIGNKNCFLYYSHSRDRFGVVPLAAAKPFRCLAFSGIIKATAAGHSEAWWQCRQI